MTNPTRYISIALILTNGCTASTQVWTNDRAEAMKVLEQMLFDAHRQRNDAILAAICDEYEPIVRFNVTETRAMIIKEARS